MRIIKENGATKDFSLRTSNMKILNLYANIGAT